MKRPAFVRTVGWMSATVVTLAVSALSSTAQAQQKIYSPISLPSNQEISDVLSNRDIPTGAGGFARDYTIQLEGGDQVAIDLLSDEFDTLVVLMGPDGTTIGENDDGPDGTTNSLLFSRITEAGLHTVRVQSYAGQGTGTFRLKVARLRPIE